MRSGMTPRGVTNKERRGSKYEDAHDKADAENFFFQVEGGISIYVEKESGSRGSREGRERTTLSSTNQRCRGFEASPGEL